MSLRSDIERARRVVLYDPPSTPRSRADRAAIEAVCEAAEHSLAMGDWESKAREYGYPDSHFLPWVQREAEAKLRAVEEALIGLREKARPKAGDRYQLVGYDDLQAVLALPSEPVSGEGE